MTSTAASSPSRSRAASASGETRRLLVSIHDVTPALDSKVRALWEICRARRVVPALLVVPDWHGKWPLAQFPVFTDWLKQCARAGAETFLHGYRHDEVGLPRSRRDGWRAFGKTAREGEFLTLDERAARERIEEGLTVFRRLGLDAMGFVPPAWLSRPACGRAVAASGLRLSEDDRAVHIYEPAGARRVPSPVVRWSGRTPLRARGSSVVAAVRWHAQRRARNVRIALHPSDLDHPATTRSLYAELERWLSDRPSSRYAEL